MALAVMLQRPGTVHHLFQAGVQRTSSESVQLKTKTAVPACQHPPHCFTSTASH